MNIFKGKEEKRVLILLAFAVYDSKAECFLRPYFAETKGLAVRAFSDAANDPQHEMCRHAEDYTLFYIGSFDQMAGELQRCAPESLLKAIVARKVA